MEFHSARKKIKSILDIVQSFWQQPRLSRHLLRRVPITISGFTAGQKWLSFAGDQALSNPYENGLLVDSPNPLKSYFESHTEGRGIWKWMHYFDIYQRHFSKFVGRKVHVLEVGIYSGGSLDMWRDYFGPNCHVYGVDIEEACRVYENDYTKVFVGNQADRGFWKQFKEQVSTIDILIDDGGHLPEQQIVTLDEMLPHLRAGGVYLCEDIHGDLNTFLSFVYGLVHNLHAFVGPTGSHDKNGLLSCTSTQFQSEIHSIHFYPFVMVIEKTNNSISKFIAPKHGNKWQPFIP